MKQNKDKNKQKQMKVIGLTGGVGCGKSTVASIITSHFPVQSIFTDEVAREQMRKGGSTYSLVVQEFGKSILDLDGEIDRKKLSDIVFTSERAKQKLNELTHPEVRNFVLEQIKKWNELNLYFAVLVETALFIEAGYKDFCDEVWYVYASEAERRKRLKQARNYTDEKINLMFSTQASEEEFYLCATHIINNQDGITEAMIVKQINCIIKEWE